MLETAWHAPTGRNARQVHFSVIDDREVGFAMSFGKPAVSYARTVQHRNGLIHRVKPLRD